MSTTSPVSTTLLPPSGSPPLTFRKLLAVYLGLTIVPYLWAWSQGLEVRGTYETILTILNIAMFAALLAQYPLAGRVRSVTNFAGLDNGMQLHRKAGEIIAIYFFLHPFLILAPRFLYSQNLALENTWDTFIAGESVTGVYAWAIMSIWVLMSVYRDKLGMSYEAWRISHGLGLVAVAILGTHHAVTVGRHGRYDLWFDVMWIALCTIAVGIVAFTYFVRPYLQQKQPFKLVHAKRLSTNDWELTIEKDGDFPFKFDAGQFLWINTSGNSFNRAEHPYSIASSPTRLPRISFIIRELGDWSRSLGNLKPGQRVYVDGPHGVFTLNGQEAAGVALIAGGAGIGPNLGILRQLRDLGESRPVRLIYGNRRMDQMVCQDEVNEIEAEMDDFKQHLVLETPESGVEAHEGFIDRDYLASMFDQEQRGSWIFYVCGPPVMVDAVTEHLRKLGIDEARIMFEQLAF